MLVCVCVCVCARACCVCVFACTHMQTGTQAQTQTQTHVHADTDTPRLEHPSRSVMVTVLAAPVPSTETLCPCGSRPRSDHLAPPTHHHVQAHSPHVAPAHASPPPATAARSRTHRVLLPIPSRNSCVRSTRTAAVIAEVQLRGSLILAMRATCDGIDASCHGLSDVAGSSLGVFEP